MNERFSWTTGLGRWGGVALQVHLLFYLFAIVVFGVEWHYLQQPGRLFGTAVATVGVVFFLAIFHEIAHAWAAVNLGGHIRHLIVTPWGGPSRMVLPAHPRAQLLVYFAGPLFHLFLFGIGALLLVATGHNRLLELVNPLAPLPLRPGQIDISLIQIATWVNFQMLVVNLIPASPFDGSRILRGILQSHDPLVPQLRVETLVMASGLASGIVLFALAWALRDVNEGPIQPTWLILVTGGILLMFVARHEFHQWFAHHHTDFSMLDELMNHDLPDDDFQDSGFGDDDAESLADWMIDQLPGSELAERSVAIEEERRVDRILEKLHRHGLGGLNDDERSFLNRISQQYRRRREMNR